jgi:predicted ATPase/DNA-binding winged helix-turn-helix (wHTH) protein
VTALRRIQLGRAATCAVSRSQVATPTTQAGRVPVRDCGSVLRFGPFQLLPAERLLLESGKVVKLGARAFDLLTLLVERAGQVVSKEHLISHVWPTTVVEEINLRVHVAAVRRALGDGQSGNRYIVNATGRGYSFVAKVTAETGGASIKANQTAAAAPNHNLPNPLTRMVGRSHEVQALVRLARSQRLLTVVGAAGVGKSTVAIAVARELLRDFPDGIRFVDLAAISSSALVPGSFATALGLAVSAGSPLADLVAFLKEKTALLLLDNCEHLVDEVASVTEQLLKGSPTLHVLATSREPLSAEGEWQYRISPLAVPTEDSGEVTAEFARGHSAVEFFVERAITGDQGFELTDENAPIVAQICRALDGLPLAIEFAAARLGLLGIRELAVRVDDQVSRGGAPGRRTADSRHQTLRATLDWSFDLLKPTEQVVLQRLAVFNGAFTMESAVALTAHNGLGPQEALNAAVGLADKSLMTTDVSGMTVRHRLLNTTRAYAFEKLAETEDFASIYRWHAEQILKLMRQAELGWETMPRAEWVASYGYAIDDVRAALDWAFSSDGDAFLGAALTAVSVPFGLQLMLVEEFHARVEHALYWIRARTTPHPEIEGRLRMTLATLSQNMQRPSAAQQAEDSLAGDPVELIGSPKLRVAPLLRKTIFQIEAADYDGAVNTAARLGSVARKTGDPLAVLIADRVAAQAHHFCGNHRIARTYAERVLDHPAKAIPLAYIPVQVDRRVWMRIVLARILWMEGNADQAVALSAEALELAASDSPFAVCQSLALAACPIAFWRGDKLQEQEHVMRLLREAARYRLDYWRMYGEWYQRALTAPAEAANQKAGPEAPSPTSAITPARGLLLDTMLTIAPGLSGVDARASNAGGWSAAETLRVQAQDMLRDSSLDAEGHAEELFRRSLKTAEQQNALAWTLRTAISLGALWSQKDQKAQAKSLVSEVRARFSEGFSTRDLREAASFLEGLV